MATTQTPSPRAYAIGGGARIQRVAFTAQSGDTSIALQFTSLNNVVNVSIGTLVATSITVSGNTATVTFVDPAASVVGVAEGHGN